jgi:preprotein translocase subunit SecA
MFNELLSAIQKEVVNTIYKISIGIDLTPSIMEKGNITFQGAEKSTVTEAPVVNNRPKDSEGKEIGRNDPCYCGSGKKYKKCHLQDYSS